MITIREIQVSDAAAFLDLCNQLDKETGFMLIEPGERLTTVEEQLDRIEGLLSRFNQTILVAECAGRLVGYLAGLGGSYRRNRHNVHIVIGILQEFTGQGIGKQLFKEIEAWGLERGMHRLELTVMADNRRAIGLYRKLGFEIEGTKKDSLFVDGMYVDEICMAKLIS